MASTKRELIKKRTGIKTALTRFVNYFNSIGKDADDLEIENLKCRYEDILNVIEKYAEVQGEIEILEPAANYDKERTEFENKYYDIVARVKMFLKKEKGNNKESKPVISSVSSDYEFNSNVKLPVLELPKFEGSFSEWNQFKDTFQAVVDNNPRISNVEKFYYLKACLKGRAAEAISSIQVTNENYDDAWDILSQRFENKKLSVFSHVAAIVDFPNLTKENVTSLRNLYDEAERRLRALKNLGEKVDNWGSLLIYVIISKLDSRTRKAWEEENKNSEIPTLKQLQDFLNSRCQLLEAMTNVNYSPQVKRRGAQTNLANTKICCYFCSGDHTIYKCKKFVELSASDRLKEVNNMKLCILCLGKGHKFGDCKAKHCFKCRKKHNTLLHNKDDTQRSDEQRETEVTEIAQATNSIQVTNYALNDELVLLSTAELLIQGKSGKFIKVKALLDVGSTANYATQKLAEKLGLNRRQVGPIRIIGCGGAISSDVTECITTSITSTNGVFKTDLSFLIIKKITSKLPTTKFNKSVLKIDEGIRLADPNFNTPTEVDVLIGVQSFYDIIQSKRIKLGKVNLIQSKLGWIVSGSISALEPGVREESCCLNVNSSDKLHELMERFWKTEEIPIGKFLKEEEVFCEEDFRRSTCKEKDRFVIKYPLKSEMKLGNSFKYALKRFKGMERRLEINENLKEQYLNFMQEYEQLGHMTNVEDLDANRIRQLEEMEFDTSYYIPHHSVVKVGSSTTKLRVVFDASMKTTNGVSLNDILQNGPVIQSELFAILLRFREHNIVLSADIKMMFRQIMINEKQRDLQRILWRQSKEEPIHIYRLNTLTYGLKPATYLATKCVRTLAEEHQEEFPDAARTLIENTYVDDLLAGAKDTQQALKLKSDIDEILNFGSFNLRKWRSNSKELVRMKEFQTNNDKHFLKDESEVKTLGLYWDPVTDTLRFCSSIKSTKKEEPTKRRAMGFISSLFDPLGLAAPIIVSAKIFMQSLWAQKLDWDDPLPENLKNEWNSILKQLNALDELYIVRQAVSKNCKNVQLHAFADSSMKAFGCAVYLRSVSEKGEINVRLLCAKSRVAPLKSLTLPKLELQACELLSRLLTVVKSALRLPIEKTVCWTDSSIVLHWINKNPANWKIFVANRIARIQQLTQLCTWRHCRSEDNPADLLTRGIQADKFKNSMWWKGPPWLKEPEASWPVTQGVELAPIEIPEKKKESCLMTLTEDKNSIFERYSSMRKLQRVFAWCFRFLKNTRQAANEKIKGVLTVEELRSSMTRLLKLAQGEVFKEEIEDLEKGKRVQNRSSILKLDPFLDEEKLLRVGGRIDNSDYSYEKKHPIILPKAHLLTKLIILQEHHKNIHMGPQALLCNLRERFWPTAGLSMIKIVLRNCTLCSRFKPRRFIPKMGNLPKERITPSRVFESVSLDYAGPFLIKESKFRNKRFIKCYVVIFVCFSTKAVHVELVSDLTTESFINSLKRFVARRGIPSLIYSDNATNFVAAEKMLKDALLCNQNSELVQNYLSENYIRWKFMPARSPHFGGLHESNIKCLKLHLRKMFHDFTPAIEDMNTMLCQIESILNSRPLSPLTENINDLSALTPGHFIIGTNLRALPGQESNLKVSNSRKGMLQNMQTRLDNFWKQWSKQYIVNLQQRERWMQEGKLKVKEGMLVLLRDEQLPSNRWRLARVLEIIPDKQGTTRVVRLRTSTGETTRAVHQIAPLIEDPTDFNGGRMDGLHQCSAVQLLL